MASARSADTVISMRSLLIAGLLALSAAPQEKGHRTLVLDAPSGAFTVCTTGRRCASLPVAGPRTEIEKQALPSRRRAGRAKDHPHHTSMWLAHGDVNGRLLALEGATPRVDVVGEPKLAVKAGVDGGHSPTGSRSPASCARRGA